MFARVAARPPFGAVDAAPQHGTHARIEFAKAERLGDVVVGAVFQPGHAIVLAGPRGQHDDRHVRHVRPRPQNPADLESADDRQVQIQDDEIRRTLADRFERRVSRSDDLRFGFAAALERVLDESGNVLFVFDDEYAMSGHQPPR